ncbi:fluoride efflux transporter CrcB [Nocardia sp. NPDC024068]|uniref:fluoride efflux transporter CrcB n=1 Tax=Nocardia sp. NPDC024068 TaxID=3157197 RepID=UPI0033EB0844
MTEFARPAPIDARVVAVVAVGGGIGAVARYGLAVWLPHRPESVPWGTFLANVTGCLAIGVLMVLITEVWRSPHRLIRPFLGVGVLGGFTTFSSYSAEVRTLLESGTTAVAFGYLVGTVVVCLGAVVAGMGLTRRITGRRDGTT